MSFFRLPQLRSLASRQLIANVIGRAWILLSNILFLPIYLHILGAESFGIIAIFTAMAGLIVFLDMGLSPTLSRELNDRSQSKTERRNVLFSFEIAYAFLIASIVVIALVLPQHVFSLIVSSNDFVREEVRYALRWIFISAAAQLWLNFYVSALFGIERQITGNVISISVNICRNALVIVPLLMFKTPIAFLLWHLAVSVVYVVVARSLLYKTLNVEEGGALKFGLNLILRNRFLSGSIFLTSIAAAVNTQIDKIFISRFNGFEALTSYSLAVTLAQLLVLAISPLNLLILPRLIRFVSVGESQKAAQIFNVAHRVVAVFICSSTGVLIAFGPALVEMWTGGRIKASQVAPYLPLLSIGYCMLALQILPHSLAIAHKNMRGSLLIAASVIFTIPAYWISIEVGGPMGAAMIWGALQSIVFPIYFLWVIREHAPSTEAFRTLISTVVAPLLTSATICFAASYLFRDLPTVSKILVVLPLAWIASALCCCVMTVRPEDRRLLKNLVFR